MCFYHFRLETCHFTACFRHIYSENRILRRVLKATFQKARFFSIGQRRATLAPLHAGSSILIQVEVRTVNARRMFREKDAH